jgi:hypothetical protein
MCRQGACLAPSRRPNSSAATGLAILGPHLAPGSVLVFDEYVGNARWREDEHRAFLEAAGRMGWRFEELSLSWLTGQGVVRLVEADGGAFRAGSRYAP